MKETAPSPETDEANGWPYWQRNLYVAWAAWFLLMAAMQLISPFLALFIHQELGMTDMRQVELWAGAIQSANMFMAALVSPWWGALADRHGRKVMVIRASAAVSFFSLISYLVRNVYELLGIRLLMGLFSGFGATCIALVGSGTPPRRLGYAMGVLSTGPVAGAVFGPLAGGFLSSTLGYRRTFVVTGLISLLGCVLVAALVREPRTPSSRASALPLSRQLREVATVPGLLSMFGVLLMAQVANTSAGPQIALFVLELTGDPQQAPTLAGLVFAATGVGSMLAAPLLGRRADRLGYRRTLLLTLAGGAIFVLPQALVTSPWQLAALRLLLGIFVGGILPTANALIGHLAPPARRGTAYGLTGSATFLGNFLGPMLGGIVAASTGLRAIFLFTGCLLLANLLWVSLTARREARVGA